MNRRILIPLACLIVVKAVIFAVVVLPWQGPDEALRFEYARLFSRSGWSTLTPVSDFATQHEILVSMTQFGAWKLMDLPEPSETGLQRLEESPLRKDSASTSYPPLYYLLLGNFWRLLGVERLLPQLFLGRLISVLLGWLHLLLLVQMMNLLWPAGGGSRKLCALTFVAFLPQWSYLGAVVHSDNWSNLLSAGILLLFLIVARKTGEEAHPEMPRPAAKGSRWKALMALALLFLLMVISTRATNVMLVCVFTASTLMVLGDSVRSHRRRVRFALVAVGLCVLIVGGLLLLQKKDESVSGLEEAVGRGLMQRGAETPLGLSGTLLSGLDRVTVSGLMRSALILFITFWLALGRLVNKIQIGWLLLFGFLCLCCIRGLLRRPLISALPDFLRSWLLLLVAPLVTVGAVFYVYGPHQHLAPEGRYLLLVLPAIALLLAEGWCRCFSGRHRHLAVDVWICGWIFLNMTVFFGYIVPLYYL